MGSASLHPPCLRQRFDEEREVDRSQDATALANTHGRLNRCHCFFEPALSELEERERGVDDGVGATHGTELETFANVTSTALLLAANGVAPGDVPERLDSRRTSGQPVCELELLLGGCERKKNPSRLELVGEDRRQCNPQERECSDAPSFANGLSSERCGPIELAAGEEGLGKEQEAFQATELLDALTLGGLCGFERQAPAPPGSAPRSEVRRSAAIRHADG